MSRSKMEQAMAAPYFTNLGFFNANELSKLSRTSRTLEVAATEEFYRSFLLKYIVLGQQYKAEALIRANPECLLRTFQATDYSGRTIIASPFKAAIGAGDKPMWEMIRTLKTH